MKEPIVDHIYNLCKNQPGTDASHDFAHTLRVLKNALQIQEKEGGDKEIIQLAALLHDAKNMPKGHPDAKKSSEYSANYAKELLTDLNYPDEKIEIVYDAILCHSFSLGKVPKFSEGKVLQDADRLDSLGAIGIARCFAVAGLNNASFYKCEDPFFQTDRPLNDSFFALDHFYRKLFRLPELLQTETGKQMAEARINTMQKYLEALANEV